MSCSLAEWLWRPEALSSSPCVDTLRIDSCGEYRRYVEDVTLFDWTMAAIDSVPQAVQVACHNGDAQTNKLTNHDSRTRPVEKLEEKKQSQQALPLARIA